MVPQPPCVARRGIELIKMDVSFFEGLPFSVASKGNREGKYNSFGVGIPYKKWSELILKGNQKEHRSHVGGFQP